VVATADNTVRTARVRVLESPAGGVQS
jgi:hypothetical protein